MTPALSSRDRRVLAFGLVTCCTLIVAARGVPALLRWTRAAQENAAQLGAEAARAERSVREAHSKPPEDQPCAAALVELGTSLSMDFLFVFTGGASEAANILGRSGVVALGEHFVEDALYTHIEGNANRSVARTIGLWGVRTGSGALSSNLEGQSYGGTDLLVATVKDVVPFVGSLINGLNAVQACRSH